MMAAPSSTSRRLLGGMDPGVMPPTSAWWPRDATKNLRRGTRSAAGGLVADARRRGGRGALDAALVEHRRDDGDVGQVRPARQLRVVGRQHVARAQALGRALALRAPEVRLHARPLSVPAQPGCTQRAPRSRALAGTGPRRRLGQAPTWNWMAADMAPRCTGRCGALATSAPEGSKSAQLKSRRSLMLTLMEVRCRTRPICSAMPMNLRRSGALACVEPRVESCTTPHGRPPFWRCRPMQRLHRLHGRPGLHVTGKAQTKRTRP